MNFFGHQQEQKYEKSILFETIFQARFPNILKIVNGNPSEFQTNMRNQGYPAFAVNAVAIQDIFKPDLGQLSNLSNIFIFSSEDEHSEYKVSLSKDSISLTCLGNHAESSEFKNRLISILDAFGNIYEFSNFTRVGLRHRNIANKVFISNITDEDIISFIPEYIFPEFIESGSEEINYLEKKYVLNDNQIMMNVAYVIATVSGKYGKTQVDNQWSYFIDVDCFTELSITEVQYVSELYDTFIRNYWSAFEWGITDKLREKLA